MTVLPPPYAYDTMRLVRKALLLPYKEPPDLFPHSPACRSYDHSHQYQHPGLQELHTTRWLMLLMDMKIPMLRHPIVCRLVCEEYFMANPWFAIDQECKPPSTFLRGIKVHPVTNLYEIFSEQPFSKGGNVTTSGSRTLLLPAFPERRCSGTSTWTKQPKRAGEISVLLSSPDGR